MPEPQQFNVGTLGEMSARIIRWSRERLDADTVNDAINDALESLWQTVSLASLSRFTTGPVTQTVMAGSTQLAIVSIADPEVYLQVGTTPGGGLPARTLSFAFSYVTDSGSETRLSLSQVSEADAAQLFVAQAPVPVAQAIGWNLFAGVAGRFTRQNISPLPFDVTWIEPPFGATSSPDGSFPQPFNNTADNIQAIKRISASNISGTKSRWRQGDVTSLLFSEMEGRLQSNSTFTSRAYDLIDNRVVEIRPAGQIDVDVDLYYLVKPRRLRFPQSTLPFLSLGVQGYLRNEALADILLSLGEDEEAAARQSKADHERQRITLSVLGDNWDKNNIVRPFRSRR